MGLSETEKINVVTVLGYPSHVINASSKRYDRDVDDCLSNIHNDVEVREILANIDTMDKIICSHLEQGNKVLKLADIEFNPSYIKDLKEQRNLLVGKLSNEVNIVVKRNSTMRVIQ